MKSREAMKIGLIDVDGHNFPNLALMKLSAWHSGLKARARRNPPSRKLLHWAEHKEEAMRKAIAIDFDGCLCKNAWPDIGEPNWDVIQAALEEKRRGTALILWTCRAGDLLDAALAACSEWGVTFDAANENLPERIEHYGTESRKVSADEYWDDCAVHMPEPPNAPLTLGELRGMDGDPVWVVFIPDADGEQLAMWALVSVDDKNDEISLLNSIGGSSAYEEVWADIEAIYRRKTEAGMK